MKIIFLLILCFVVLKGFSQTNELMVEEKASKWIKITAPVATVSKPKTSVTVRKKTATTKPPAPKQDTQKEFEKTNNEVNRFKKTKKG